MIIYGISIEGGFYAADTERELGAYAIPDSPWADLAKDTDAQLSIVDLMLSAAARDAKENTTAQLQCYAHALDMARESECERCGHPHNGATDRLCSERCRRAVATDRERAHMVATRTCPSCRKAGALTRKQASQGHQCDACADRDERRAGLGL